jgi:hypothetical protein
MGGNVAGHWLDNLADSQISQSPCLLTDYESIDYGAEDIMRVVQSNRLYLHFEASNQDEYRGVGRGKRPGRGEYQRV